MSACDVCEDCDSGRTVDVSCGNNRCAECHSWACSMCRDSDIACVNAEMCGGRSASWVAGGCASGETYACASCVALHATERMEPGVTWTRIDGKATMTDGLVMVRA